MTWIIGTPTFWGYGVGISDIRVCLPDGRSLDCLQKIYPVGRYIAAGFAGSVKFGFWAVSDLQRLLYVGDPRMAWVPGKVVFKWYRHARRAFKYAPDSVKDLGAQLMLVGVSPTADLGIRGYARPTVAILRAPDFFPCLLKINAVEAIGSGATIGIYVRAVESLNSDSNPLLKAEVGMRGGYAIAIMHVIRMTIQDHPEATVSPHVHVCLVRRGEIRISNSDTTVYPRNGPPIKIRMPPVATTWPEFERLCQDAGADAIAATA